MNISNNGINLIKNFEGLRLKAYKCPSGIWTIGYGHTGADVFCGLVINKNDAENLLKKDLIVHCNNVSKIVKVQLNQNQFDALVSFEYNVGYSNFKNSTLLKLLNQKKYLDSSCEFEKWVYSKKIKLNGLVKRRLAEKELFLKNC